MDEPVSLAEAKKHLRVDSSIDDTLIGDKIQAAREWVEDYTGLILTPRRVTESVSSLVGHTRLRAWPIDPAQPVEVAYRDALGVDQTIASAIIRAASRPAVLYPPVGVGWPINRAAGSAAVVTFSAGFPTPASIPQKLKQAMLVMLTAFYEDREGGALFVAAERSARSLCRGSRGTGL